MKKKTDYIKVLVAMCVMLAFSQCKKDDPDPLSVAAGIYSGSISDNGRIISGVKATVTTETGDGVLYIKSIGFSSPNYQLVLTGSCTKNNCGMSGQLGTYRYHSSQVSADGQSLNVEGSYKVKEATNSFPAQYANFSFTGTR
jgi:hypothetical protein